MRAWLSVIEGLGVLLVLLVIALAFLAIRRRWLDRLGGTFECSLRLNMTTPGTGWALGVGRYNEGILEWFRFFSYALRPHKVFDRAVVRVLETRVALSSENRVLRLETRAASTDEEWELAMSQDSLTGLLSWLEAAPPGLRRVE